MLLGAVHLLCHTILASSGPPPPLKSYCVIIWLTPPYPPHVWRDKWIRYFIKRIIFKHHFKGVGELLIILEWWNQLLFNLIHIVIVELLYFQAKTSPFLCVFCFDLAIIFMPFWFPPPVIVIHHNWSYPPPPPCHNVSYFCLPPPTPNLYDIINERPLIW